VRIVCEHDYIMNLVGCGNTAKEARDEFYDGLQHYLPRAFRTTVDMRGKQAQQFAANVAKETPEEMSRDELKAALNLPSSSKMRTAKMIEQLNAQANNTQQATAPAPKPKATQPNAKVNAIMSDGVDFRDLFTQILNNG
jgi:2,3-bisphosphoglycerate-independent phosphoglycerate mutase